MDAQQDGAYADRVFRMVLGFAEMASIAVGDRLGWYRDLADAGDGGLTAEELARHSNTAARYTREWLEQQAVAGLLEMATEQDGTAPRFKLPPGATGVLVEPDSLDGMAPMVRMMMAGVQDFPRLLQAYRDGTGVAWALLGDEARESQADANRPWFEQRLAGALASVPQLHATLSRPSARILDIACGFGSSTVALARAYPGATITGVDIDGPSIARARESARALGERVEFIEGDAGALGDIAACDAAFVFEALHDMPFPVQVLAALRKMCRPGGVVVVMDEAVADTFAPDGDDVERLMYGYSLFVCLPDSLSTPGSVGTGTVMRAATLAAYAKEAGFTGVQVLPIEGFCAFRFYLLSS